MIISLYRVLIKLKGVTTPFGYNSKYAYTRYMTHNM